VEEATARAMAFPLAGSPATKNTRRVFLKGVNANQKVPTLC